MPDTAQTQRVADVAMEPFAALEFELALDLQDPVGAGFEACVRHAADAVGGEMLFEMPADGTIDDASRIAAVRVPEARGDRIVFAVLDQARATVRIASRADVGERFHGFARAFVGVLERLRAAPKVDDAMHPAGSA